MRLESILSYYFLVDWRSRRLHAMISSILVTLLIPVAAGGWPGDWRMAFGMLASLYLSFVGLFIYPLRSDILAVPRGSDSDALLLFPVSHKRLFILGVLYSLFLIDLSVLLYFILVSALVYAEYHTFILGYSGVWAAILVSMAYAGLMTLFAMLASGVSRTAFQAVRTGYLIGFILVPSLSTVMLLAGAPISIAPYYFYVICLEALYMGTDIPSNFTARPTGIATVSIPKISIPVGLAYFAIYYIALLSMLYILYRRSLR